MRTAPLTFFLLLAPLSAQALPEPLADRWLVTFEQRSFDLSPMRAAIARGASAAEYGAIIESFDTAARRDQAPFAAFVERLGGRVLSHYWIYNGCHVQLPPAAVGAVRAHPTVKWLHQDGVAEKASAPLPMDRAGNSANHAAQLVHRMGIRGAGVAVAIVDEGVDSDMNGIGRPHAAYYIDGDPTNTNGGGLSGSRLLALIQVGAQPAEDGGGHGTGVSGVVAGAKWSSHRHNADGHAPRAQIVGYSIADTASGGAFFSTFVAAWQRIAADRVQYNIVAANNSYGGTPDPTHPSQQALDAVIKDADVMVIVAAGNSGASTSGSQSCANGLAVGATDANTRAVSAISSRGPLSGDTQRFYPDLCAVGIGVRCPLRDREDPGLHYSGCCTSFASPQVCGAATLYRSVRTTATALQTKAAILATLEDVSGKNPNPPFDTRNAYGLGFLRDDRLIALAQGGGLESVVQLTTANPVQSVTMNVQAGVQYAVAAAWHRIDYTVSTWSDVALTVRQGSTVLASSDDPRNLCERVRFTAPANGTVQIEVRGVTLDAPMLDVAIAGAPTANPFTLGSALLYGNGCNGTGASHVRAAVVPPQSATAFGGVTITPPIGHRRHRYQHVVRGNLVPAGTVIRGIAFRPDERVASEEFFNTNYWMDAQIDIGVGPNAPGSLSLTFASNVTGSLTTVRARGRIELPDPAGTAQSVDDWRYEILFDRPFTWTAPAGQHLVIEITKYEHSLSGIETARSIDAELALNMEAATVFAFDPLATTGRGSLAVPVLALLSPQSPAPPAIAWSDRPSIGNHFAITLSQGRANAAAALAVGASDQTWGGLRLPFDLTPFGASGCTVLASLDLVVPLTLDGDGVGSLATELPDWRRVIGLDMFAQGYVLDATANRLGLALSPGLHVAPGGRP